MFCRRKRRYLRRFDRYVFNEDWSRGPYVIYLSDFLTGNALDVYTRPIRLDNDYDHILGKAVLEKYQFTVEDHRRTLCHTDENASQFVGMFDHFINQWIELSNIELSHDRLNNSC